MPEGAPERAARARLSLARRVAWLLSGLLCAFAAHAENDAPVAPRARALLDQDRWREALALVDAGGDDAESLAVRGEALYRGGRLDEAIATLAPLCERPGAPARALVTLGLLRKAEGKEEEATVLVERALAVDGADRIVLFQAASFAPTHLGAAARLQAYLERSTGDDPDRIEAARGALEFHRAIGERKTWIARQHPAHLEVPLRSLGGRGAVSAWVVDVSLGPGAPVPLLLDSGAGGLFLVERVARKRGFVPLARETAFGGGAAERHATQRGILPAFAIGDLRFSDALVSASRAEVEPTGRYQGILGLDVFEGYTITLDLKKGRLVLDDARDDVSDASGRDASGRPYWSVSGQILVDASATDGPRGLFLVDTGASTSVVDRSYAGACPGAALGPSTGLRGYGGAVRGARSVRGLRFDYDGMALEGRLLEAADLTVRSRMGGVEVAGFLGLDLWNGAALEIDTRMRRIRVRNSPLNAAGGGPN